MTYVQRRAERRVVDALNAEWEYWVDAGPTVLPSCVTSAAFPPCTDLDDVLRLIGAEPDRTLLALLQATQSGDRVAGRIVLQALLPKMVLMARRDRWAGVSDYLGQLWCVLLSYPLDRRPRGVAGNLVLDTLKQVVRDRTRGPEHVGTDPDGERDWRPAVAVGPTEAERVLSSAHDLALIDPETGAILRTVYLDGLSSRQAAERHGGSPEMVRYRCSRAVRRLAGHAVELAAA